MTAGTPPPLYTLHEADPNLVRGTVLSLWRGNLQHEYGGHEAKYDWFYLRSPSGPPLLQLIRHEPSGDWVGVCAAGRRRMLWQGREIRGGVIVDFAVSPDHRSLGPALMLQQGVIAAGTRHLDLLYGFPNPKAVAAVKRTGYEKLADIVSYTRVLRHARYLARYMSAPVARILGPCVDLAAAARDALLRLRRPRLHAEWSERADPRMDALWQQSDHGDGLLMVRDAAYARWRFDDAPHGTTRYLLVSSRPGGNLRAWFATRSESGVLRVRDFWADDAIRGVGASSVDALQRAARAAGHDAVTVEIAAPEACLAGWRSCGFLERERQAAYGHWSVTPHAATDIAIYLTSADKDS